MPGKVRGGVRDIHMCASMEQLNSKIVVNESSLPKNCPARLERSAQLVLDRATEHHQNGDEETAYIFYMKYLHISQFAQKLPKSQHSMMQSILDNVKLKTVMTTAELLSNSLTFRYNVMAMAREKETENKRPITPEPPKNSTIAAINGNAEVEYENFVTSRELYGLIEKYRGSRGLLIMDVRTSKDFKESHLDAPCIINVPEDILQPGKTTSKIEKELPAESLALWSQRGDCDYVVLMDWSSKYASLLVTSKAKVLRTILEKWDVKIVYKRKALLLEGGYEDWISTYPTVSTNPNVSPPSLSDPNLDDLLDNVEYPMWNEASPKQQPAVSLPSVDRGLKPSFQPSEILNSSTPIVNTAPSITPVVNFVPPIARALPRISSVTPSVPKTQLAGEVEANASIPSFNRAVKKDAIERMEREKKKASDQVRELMKQKAVKEREMEVLRISRIAEADVEIHRHKEQELLAEIEKLQKRCQQQETEKERLQLQLDEARKSDDQSHVPRVAKPSSAPVVPEKPRLPTGPSEIGTRMEALKVDGPTGGLTRSHSSPNINNMDDNVPIYDRGTKPVPTPPKSQIEPTRHRDFSPVHGNRGRGLTGLRNLGNSCYMNSIVQCISNTISLNEYFCKGEYRNDIDLNTRTRGQIVEELAAVVKALWHGDFRTIACRDFKRVAGSYHSDFAGFRQQDSHEFLTLLMDWLHDDLNKRRNIKPPPSGSEHEIENKREVHSAATKAWQDFLLYNDSLILQLFYGQQSSTVQCQTCRFESVTFEPFSSLTLVLPSDVDKCTLQECLEMYLAPEPVSEWKCPRCTVARSASKKFDIWRLPQILVIHFKRFYEDVLWRKQHTMVDFPLSRLKMSNFVASSQHNQFSYDLYAVSNHYGTMDGGHYTTYSRNSNNKWYKFDDAEVSEISESNVRSNAAYILFYTMPAHMTRYFAS